MISLTGCSSSLDLILLINLSCSGQSSRLSSHCDPVYHSLLSILLREAPLLPKSTKFIPEGQCFHWISSSLEIWAIFLTLFAMKTFHDFPGFEIQYKATILSIQIVTDLIGHPFSAWQRFFARFTAIWPLISSSLAIDVFRLDILDFEVSRPFTFIVPC